ncbi:hypothetical protein LTR08_003306 [Meristemomyces frigidus]|nr:hypothetical protein LTR08_003306 [Meristemomyces frigidus]
MCHKLLHQHLCTHATPSISHCPAGLKLGFTCAAFDPRKAAVVVPASKTDYCCGGTVCCVRDRRLYEGRLEEARGKLACARGGRDVKRAGKEVERAEGELGRVGGRHVGCGAGGGK